VRNRFTRHQLSRGKVHRLSCYQKRKVTKRKKRRMAIQYGGKKKKKEGLIILKIGCGKVIGRSGKSHEANRREKEKNLCSSCMRQLVEGRDS